MAHEPNAVWLQQFSAWYDLMEPLSECPVAEYECATELAEPVLTLEWHDGLTVVLAAETTREGTVLWEFDPDGGQRRVGWCRPALWARWRVTGALVLWWMRANAQEGTGKPRHAIVEGIIDHATLRAFIHAVWPREAHL